MTKQYEVSRKYLILLLIYGIVSFGIFCLALFPKEKVVRQALYRFSEQSDYLFAAKEFLVKFPDRVELKDFTITKKEARAEAFPHLQIDTVQIEPKYGQLLLRKLGILFNLKLYQGSFRGVGSFDLFKPHYLRELNCQGQGIQLGSLKQLSDLFNIHISGELSGQARIKVEKNSLEALSGDYNFEVASGNVQIMSFPSFSFRQINGQGSLSEGKVKIRSMRILGDDLQAQITGDLQLNKEIARSYLKLRVSLRFSEEMKEKLGPLVNILPPQGREGTVLTIRGNLNNLSFLPT